ncbi:hypothetical protein B0H17DRAFT_1083857 [Mycena rosella]|uniref:Fungal-type protein kinase domain-containing protein n=1 Tax=Mycena rosella TaxID=1033263 RepID=A0AAD7D0V8_MYCRO|nr:hypothetical protein B0H17DRAFT_1083857 [Mycena rosella]
MKRMLVQASNFEEFSAAFMDFVDAFLSQAESVVASITGKPVSFAQRELDSTLGGLVHDLDMAGQLIVAEVVLIIGTLPFMAVDLLINGPPHKVEHDLHSLLFVLTLFYWTYEGFTGPTYPEQVSATGRRWPTEVLPWGNRPVFHTLAEIGVLKRMFFAKPEKLEETLEAILSSWDEKYLEFFWVLHNALWKPSLDFPDWMVDKSTVTPAEVREVLKTYLSNSN